MTTYEAVGHWLVRRAETRRARRAMPHTLYQALWNLLTVLAGLVLLSAAAWYVALPLGLAVSGLSCFVLGKLVRWDSAEGS